MIGPNRKALEMVGRDSLARRPERWEQGSDFHLSLDHGYPTFPWTRVRHSLWGSGRDALRALLQWGRATQGWRRLLVPSYYCHDVTAAVIEVDVRIYRQGPLPTTAPLQVKTEEGDVVLVAALFGRAPAVDVVGSGVLVEDHTHDPLAPWARNSQAHYAFSSLRKTLPLPDGGVLWSPRDLEAPAERPASLAHDRAALQRLGAMTLKRHYLNGEALEKEEARSLAILGEAQIGRGEISGISSFARSRLGTLPAARWRGVRAANLRVLRRELRNISAACFLDAPFAGLLLFDRSDDRDRVRDALIAARIYPAVLWPLEDFLALGIPEEDLDVGRRILAIHCDYRYDRADIIRVSTQVRHALSGHES